MQLTVSASALKVLALDVLFLAVICLTPAFSHLLSFPLYHLDPMRICILTSILFVADKRHAVALALLLPTASCLLAAMPSPISAAIIALELSINVLLFFGLRQKMNAGLAVFTSILVSKGLYYGCKFLLLAPAVLISTPIGLQFAVAVVMSLLFAVFFKKAASGENVVNKIN